jgi:hypothetical protein
MKNFSFGFWAIITVLGGIWLRSGWEKFSAGNFAKNLQSTLLFFANGAPNNPTTAAGNPHPFVKNFLMQVAVPNSQIFGHLTLYGEIGVGISLIALTALYHFSPISKTLLLIGLCFSLIVSILLSATFWLSAGWTSPSTETVNLFMLLIEVVALFTVGANFFPAVK